MSNLIPSERQKTNDECLLQQNKWIERYIFCFLFWIRYLKDNSHNYYMIQPMSCLRQFKLPKMLLNNKIKTSFYLKIKFAGGKRGLHRLQTPVIFLYLTLIRHKNSRVQLEHLTPNLWIVCSIICINLRFMIWSLLLCSLLSCKI